jgi:monothiol glutaredoxin
MLGEKKPDVQDEIKDLIANHEVLLFMKGTKSFPQCGFSGKVVEILKELNVDFKHVNVLEDEELKEGVKQYTHWPNVPQLYVRGSFIGGSDLVSELHEQGQLEKVFNPQNI